jgi:OOP family OmpA-OmpF porin
MPEATGNSVDGAAGANDLGELRQLLIGGELTQLARLEARVAEPAKRTADLAEVLPEAVRTAKATALGGALAPIFEKAFSQSVRKHPKELADSIYPVIGPAIRNSIAAAIQEFAEGLHQIVERSVSVRAIRWRIESIVSGKPFSEILLARSLLYSVEQVFLIHRKSGLLLRHAAAKDTVLKDADMISGMLTAIRDFLSDSFAEGGQELEKVDVGHFRLWLTYSPRLLLVGAVNGAPPVELRNVFRNALDGIEESLQPQIAAFKQGDVSVFEPAQPFLDACLLGHAAPARSRKTMFRPYAAAIAVVLLVLTGWHFYTQARWNRYFDALKHQPGVVVTGIEKSGSTWVISGFKDPDAPDPATALRAENPGVNKVRFVWQPYLSLNTPFAAQRDLHSAEDRIRKQIIRFDTNISKVAMAQADRIDDLTFAIGDLLRHNPDAKVDLIGHADEVGDAKLNDKLSLDRALQVKDALIAQGIPADAMTTAGVGNRQPLRPGSTDWERSTNRAVSFEIRAP